MRRQAIVFLFLASTSPLLFTACNACYSRDSSSPDQIRQKTADATAQVKDDAKAVVQGLRDGINRPTSEHPVDLNSASKSQLRSLPGIDDAAADRIIAGRPYASEHELLDKRVVSREEYNKIADSITVKK